MKAMGWTEPAIIVNTALGQSQKILYPNYSWLKCEKYLVLGGLCGFIPLTGAIEPLSRMERRCGDSQSDNRSDRLTKVTTLIFTMRRNLSVGNSLPNGTCRGVDHTVDSDWITVSVTLWERGGSFYILVLAYDNGLVNVLKDYVLYLYVQTRDSIFPNVRMNSYPQ